jgi:capsid portal protein
VQLGVSREVYFKQYGDPRPISAEDGRVYLKGLPAGHRPATALYNFQIPSALYAYGVPRWMNASPLVAGLRAAEEVNATHFDNNAIPRMMILVSGGTLKDGAEEKIKAAINAHVKGRQNYHSTLILQATPSSNVPTARVQIEVKPLKEAIQGDGLFQTYGANCRDTILAQYRLPKFITGLLDDVNRSTAREGLAFVEDQVFQPERTDFDAVMNMIFEHEDILYWTFVSNSPVSRDPETVAEMVGKFASAGGSTVNDVREQMGEAFNKRYPKLSNPWADMPIELAKLFVTAGQSQSVVTSGSSTGAGGVGKTHKQAPDPIVARNPAEVVAWLEQVRDELRRGEAAAHAVEVQTGQGTVLMIPMSGDDLAELVDVG